LQKGQSHKEQSDKVLFERAKNRAGAMEFSWVFDILQNHGKELGKSNFVSCSSE